MATIKIDINDLLKDAVEQIKQLALNSGNKYKDQIIKAGGEVLTSMQTDLAKWAQQLADGEITEAEFKLLSKSYETELAVAALQQTGLAEIKSVELAKSIIETIMDTAVKMVTRLLAS